MSEGASAGDQSVLVLGDGEVAAETNSLLHLGRICDAHKIAADTLERGLRGPRPARPEAPRLG